MIAKSVLQQSYTREKSPSWIELCWLVPGTTRPTRDQTGGRSRARARTHAKGARIFLGGHASAARAAPACFPGPGPVTVRSLPARGPPRPVAFAGPGGVCPPGARGRHPTRPPASRAAGPDVLRRGGCFRRKRDGAEFFIRSSPDVY